VRIEQEFGYGIAIAAADFTAKRLVRVVTDELRGEKGPSMVVRPIIIRERCLAASLHPVL
jgi:hypothetical protein